VNDACTLITKFDIPSISGTERQVVSRVANAVSGLLPQESLDRVKTAVAEAVMNAIEHGNQNQSNLMVQIEVQASERMVQINITDQGGSHSIPEHTDPNLEAKLAGMESPRGWGLFLIRNMVDEMKVLSDDTHHAVELIFYRERNETDEQQSA
jgi:anti-sigma regulatory factor (Ser/Thr protein kinase)